MRKMLLCTALLGAALTLGTGCGGDGDGAGGGGGGGEGGSGGGTGTGTSTEQAINGCTESAAEDHTGDATTTITNMGFKYAPACIKIKAGNSVKWETDFATHPLVGGEVDGSMATPDASSPITETTSGTDVTFAFPNAGKFPYYCSVHFGSGMAGAVFVVE